MLPAPGQGALALQCRREDSATRELLDVLNDAATASRGGRGAARLCWR